MSELDKTIEELEAEVLAELEEASEKPLDDGTSGSKKDLGLGSNNADEGVAKGVEQEPARFGVLERCRDEAQGDVQYDHVKHTSSCELKECRIEQHCCLGPTDHNDCAPRRDLVSVAVRGS